MWPAFAGRWEQQEAPQQGVQFVVGAANPSGLAGKETVCSSLPAGIWGMSETHLTSIGVTTVRRGFKFAKSKFSYYVPGSPARHRAGGTASGEYVGVGVLSSFPTRALPASQSGMAWSSGRIAMVATLVGGEWVQGGVVYGYTPGPTHQDTVCRTQELLEQVGSRIVHQSCGLRYICGDWNHTLDKLPIVAEWERKGWREVQQLAFQKWGVQIQNTCKNSTRKDFVFVSPELAAKLESVEVEQTFADHATVHGVFRLGKMELDHWWRKPQPLPVMPAMEEELVSSVPMATQVPSREQTERYLQIMQWYEQSAVAQQESCGHNVLPQCLGRAATFDTVKRQPVHAPIPPSRQGEVEPEFLGPSATHARWFKQLRRLQSYVQAISKQSQTVGAREHRAELWRSIRCASGFVPDFRQWWRARKHIMLGDPVNIPFDPPCCEVAVAIFNAFRTDVKGLADMLAMQRKASAVQRRREQPNLVMRDVQRAQPAPVDVLLESQIAFVEEVRADENLIVLSNPIDLSAERAVVHQGKPLQVVHSEVDALWVESCDGVVIGQPIRQDKFVGGLDEMFDAFGKEWQARWCRHDNVPDNRWDQARELVNLLPRLPVEEVPDITVPELRNAIKSKKRTAATGLDGVSRQDLLQMSDSQLSAILQVFHDAEEGRGWPEQLMNGSVASLEKRTDAQEVGHYRPICVFPVLYRIWSTLRARPVTAKIAAIAASGQLGNMPRKHAAMVWYRIQESVQTAQAEHEPLCGYVADVVKAFNCLPRAPVYEAAIRLGISGRILKGWLSAVTLMKRRFVVRHACGPPHTSSTGFPEGCSLSCVAMALVDLCYHAYLNQSVPASWPVSYVDNWEVVVSSANGVIAARQAIHVFAAALDVQVDAGKSYSWAIQDVDRSTLRAANLPVSHAAKDLGAHMQYTRKHGNATLQTRIGQLQDLWTKLRQSPADYKAKCRAIRGVAWKRALYGSSICSISPEMYQKMRTGVMAGLRVKKAGASPWAHLNFAEHSSLDPAFAALMDAVRDARSLANPESVNLLLGEWLQGGLKLPPGPVAVLVQRCHQAGVQVSHGSILIDQHGPFSLFLVSIQELQYRLQRAWHKRVGSKLAERADYAGAQSGDPYETRRASPAADASEESLWRIVIHGTMYAQDCKSKVSPCESPACPWCLEADSIQHRLWECQYFEQDRMGLSATTAEQVESLPKCLTLHGIVPEVEGKKALLNELAALPDTSGCVETIWVEGEVVDLFTDGTASDPVEPALRLGAWAVSVVAAPGSAEAKSVSCGVLPGVMQTVHRAEVQALISALHYAKWLQKPVRVWIDNQSVQERAQKIFAGLTIVGPNTKDSDLWNKVVQLAERCVSPLWAVKVASHCEPQDDEGPVETWAREHNSYVDQLADTANRQRSSRQHELVGTVRRQLNYMWKVAQEIQSVQLKIGLRATQTVALVKSQQHAPVPDQAPVRICPQIQVEPIAQRRCPQSEGKYGVDFVQHVVQWIASTQDAVVEARWISFAQLLIDFQMATGRPGPLYDTVELRWIDCMKVRAVHHMRASSGDRTRWYRIALLAILRELGCEVQTGSVRPYSTALWATLPCIAWRWKPERWELVEGWLRQQLPSGAVRGEYKALRSVPVAGQHPVMGPIVVPRVGIARFL